ncbi:DUF6668 family protein [Streptomyces sp. V4-01]|uniref:DUF6668 family protein n=1 Tax=Actinacidiphila polyblastidii TaxID=3110430 RepID=A0ABU7PF98_9ACTN|nr:DUF6668 family protein [Streptomyces sp. V4-01]
MSSAINVPRGPGLWVRGPSRPVQEVPSPDATPAGAESAAVRNGGRSPGGVAWIGVHGGSGVTTLSVLVGGADVGCRWPKPDEPSSVYLVARTHAAGLRALSQMLNLLQHDEAAPDLRLLGAVTVADAPGRLPVQLRRRLRVVGSAVPVHAIPWIPQLRLGGTPDDLPKEMAALVARTAELRGARP